MQFSDKNPKMQLKELFEEIKKEKDEPEKIKSIPIKTNKKESPTAESSDDCKQFTG